MGRELWVFNLSYAYHTLIMFPFCCIANIGKEDILFPTEMNYLLPDQTNNS